MGLNRRLAQRAVSRVSVLVVETPGWSGVRCAVEAAVRRRGWRLAVCPADADALVVCGRPGPRLRAAVDATWNQLPGPRARAMAFVGAEASSALRELHAALLDDDGQRQAAAARSVEPAYGPFAAAEDPGADSEPDGPMDHDGMDMPMPGGIPLAEGADDQDGLEMDVLHVPLGPVLPAWPAGLLLRCTLSGDVVTQAEVGLLEPAGPPPADAGLRPGSAAERLDRAVRILMLAGPEAVATEAAMLRDDLLAAADPAGMQPRLDRLVRRLRRSRLVRWSLAGRGPRDQDAVYRRLLSLLDQAQMALAGTPAPGTPIRLDELSHRVVGCQLSEVRLLVAAAELETMPALAADRG